MSHAVYITITTDYKVQISSCQKIIQEIEKIQNQEQWGEDFSANLEEQKNNVKSILSEIKSYDKTKIISENKFQLDIKIDSLLKRAYNIIENTNIIDGLQEKYAKQSANDKKKIDELIAKESIIAFVAISNLEKNNSELNYINISQEVQKIKETDASAQVSKEFRVQNEMLIKNQDCDDKIKKMLLNNLDSLRTYEELSDFSSYFHSKMRSYEQTKNLLSTFLNASKKIGFDKFKYDLETKDNKIVIKALFEKSKTKENVFIILDENLTLQYKMGDYKGHMCEKESQYLWDELEKSNFFIRDKKITRNINSSQPLERTFKTKEN